MLVARGRKACAGTLRTNGRAYKRVARGPAGGPVATGMIDALVLHRRSYRATHYYQAWLVWRGGYNPKLCIHCRKVRVDWPFLRLALLGLAPSALKLQRRTCRASRIGERG